MRFRCRSLGSTPAFDQADCQWQAKLEDRICPSPNFMLRVVRRYDGDDLHFAVKVYVLHLRDPDGSDKITRQK